jgi:hypothetical protein
MERRIPEPAVPGEKTVPVTRVFSPIVAPLACLVLFGLHLAGVTGLLDPGARFLIASFLFFFLPGDILARRALRLRPSSFPVRLLAAFLGGLGLQAVIAWVLTLLGAGFAAYLLAARVAVCSLVALFLVQELKRRRATGPPRSEQRSGDVLRIPAPSVFLAAAVLMSIFFLLSPDAINPTGDAYDHIGYARRIVADNSLAPPDVLAPAVGAATPKHDPRKGALHPILALWSRFSGLDPVVLWTYLPVVLAPVSLLAFVLFSVVILPGTGYVLAAAVLFLLFQGGIGREFFSTAAYGQNVSLVFLWTLAALSIAYLRRESRVPLRALLFLAAAAALIHIGFAVLWGLLAASLAVFGSYLRFDRRTLFRFMIGTAAVLGAIFVWKTAYSYGRGNAMHMLPQGVLFVGGHRFVVSPIEVLRADSLVFLGGIVLLPGLFFIKRHRPNARLCIALSALPVLICFNPFVAPFVFGRVAYLLHRFLTIVPSFQVVVLVFGAVLVAARRARFPAKAGAAILLFLWVKLFVLPGWGAVSGAVRSVSFGSERGVPGPDFARVIDAASTLIDDRSVVISDPLTSYVLSAYRNVAVVSVLHQHGNPNDPLVMERLAASRDALSPFVSQRESMRELERFRVGYIVLNGGFSRPVHEFMADWSPALLSDVREKYRSPRDNFRTVLESPEVVIVRVFGYYMDGETWEPTVPYLRDMGQELSPCGKTVSGGGATIRGVAVSPDEVMPGGTVHFTVQYDRNLAVEPAMPTRLSVRFDDVAYVSRFSSYPGGKYVRRMMERRGGFLSRYRVDRTLFDGFYPPAMWPLGYPVTENFRVKLPSSLKEGTYEIQMRLSTESLLPNVTLRDLLYNVDSYSSVPCARITVGAAAGRR